MLSTISGVSDGRGRNRLHENQTIYTWSRSPQTNKPKKGNTLNQSNSTCNGPCSTILVSLECSRRYLSKSKCQNTINIAAIRWAHDAAKSTHSNSGNPLRSRCNYTCKPVFFFKCVSNHKHSSIYTCTYKSLMDMVTLAVQRQSRTKIRATCHCDNGARKTRRSTSCDGNTQAATLSHQ